MADTDPVTRERTFELDWRTALLAAAVFVAFTALIGVVNNAGRVVTALAVGTVLALGLDPVVALATRRLRLPRAVAVVAVLLGFTALGLAIAAILVPPAVREADRLQDDLPNVLAELENLPLVGGQLSNADVPEKLERAIDELPERLAGDATPLRDAARSLGGGLVIGTLTLVIAISLLLDGPRLVRGARRLVPEERRDRADRIGQVGYRSVGRYVMGSLTVAAIAGTVVLAFGLAVGVPLTPLIAMWVAVFDLVPQIGGAAGGIPFVLLGFSEGAGTGVVCAVFFIVFLQIENHILQPILVGNAVKLSPLATMTAALIGVSAGGVVGALLAIPLLGAAKAVYAEFRGEDESFDDPAIDEVDQPSSR